jgi:hypothetical protein
MNEYTNNFDLQMALWREGFGTDGRKRKSERIRLNGLVPVQN